MYALTRTPTLGTMRVMGKVNGSVLVILVDIGSTHNFVDASLVSSLQLRVDVTKILEVKVANGSIVKTQGFYSSVPMCVQGVEFCIQFHILTLGGCDAMLGTQWLSTFGEIQQNFQLLSMCFCNGNQQILLLGLSPSLGSSLMDCDQFFKIPINKGLLLQITTIEGDVPKAKVPTAVESLLQEFDHVFKTPIGLPPLRGHEHQITLKEGNQPVCQRPYRYLFYQKNEIKKIVKELIYVGSIRNSSNPFAFPVLLVRKADGSWRMCIDYRALNNITIKDKFPIPIIDELLDELNGAVIFSKLDLRSRYHQIRMMEEDIPKIAFRTHEGHYEFLVMPFGLTNAPSTFQSLMNQVFKPFFRKFLLVFFDDILVYSKSLSDHIVHLRTILEILATNKLYAKRSKCMFARKEVEYLGHIITSEGVHTDLKKTTAMQQWPILKDIKSLRGFLGLIGYYKKFVKGYGQIAAPLNVLLKKDSFSWLEEAELDFQQLKATMAQPTGSKFALPNFEKTFVVECDALGRGLAAVLMQQGRPIAFHNHALKGKNLTLSTYEKELLALVTDVKRWRAYQVGRPFIVKTNQQSLKYLLEQKIGTPTQKKVVC